MNGINLDSFEKNTSKRAFIFTGGSGFWPEKMTDLPEKDDIIIAADSGCLLIGEFSKKQYEISPDIILGDMDSYKGESIEKLYPKARFVSFPPEKNDTDTALAVSTALELGCKNIIIAGGLGGRLDHTLANIYLLEYIKENGASGIITDGKNRAYLAKSENVLSSIRKYLSLIPLDDCVFGVSMDENFKYPFKAEKLFRKRFVTVSNEIVSEKALITLEKGSALIVESGD
ncbi:MAG: thiamine diphosphokinase [Ruminococcaceae bacterium]|nr:thiamine diphosphokinase [Oscillospiraceae bacterium]